MIESSHQLISFNGTDSVIEYSNLFPALRGELFSADAKPVVVPLAHLEGDGGLQRPGRPRHEKDAGAAPRHTIRELKSEKQETTANYNK